MFKQWYKENRYRLNKMFSQIMEKMDNLDIKRNISPDEIYDQFILYAYRNSKINRKI